MGRALHGTHSSPHSFCFCFSHAKKNNNKQKSKNKSSSNWISSSSLECLREKRSIQNKIGELRGRKRRRPRERQRHRQWYQNNNYLLNSSNGERADIETYQCIYVNWFECVFVIYFFFIFHSIVVSLCVPLSRIPFRPYDRIFVGSQIIQ